MCGHHHNVVVLVLELHQALGQITPVVVEHVRQAGDAEFGLVVLQIDFSQLLAQQVAHRFRAVLVAGLHHQLVELLRQTFFQRNGKAFHG